MDQISVAIIQSAAFQYSNLKEVELPQNIQSISHATFAFIKLESIVIPESFKKDTNNDFNTHNFGSSYLKSITIEGIADFEKKVCCQELIFRN